MGKHRSKRHQKMYKMKGCSKRTRKNYLGGNAAELGLAYPANNVHTVPNPFLAYTGTGGSNLASAYPSQGPAADGYGWINPQGNLHGGSVSNGGGVSNGGSVSQGFQKGGCVGGKRRYKKGWGKMKGGACNISNDGIPYPNGLVGAPYGKDIGGWPGVDGVGGNRNYYTNNTYNNDVSRQMIDLGPSAPFLGLKGGKRGSRKQRTRKQRGGNLSNFIGQDLINLGRQFNYGVGSAYNALAGYPGPVNPLPWKGHLPNTAGLSAVKAAYI
jgi:hypothetical protein